jgi:uncharacterized membrane protein SirB2
MYETLKWVHVGCVIASGAGFAARGVLTLLDSPLLAARVVRIAPHVVDTTLLASAVAMASLARLSPLTHPWLAAKIVALLAYIVLGALALRYGRSARARAAAFVGAALAFAYIVGTAVNRDPLSWLVRAV